MVNGFNCLLDNVVTSMHLLEFTKFTTKTYVGYDVIVKPIVSYRLFSIIFLNFFGYFCL